MLFKNVGQGDSIEIHVNGKVFLIDGGPSNEIGSYLPQDLCPVKAVLLTHPHNDHLIGLNRALELCSPTIVYTNYVSHTSKAWEKFNYLIQSTSSRSLYRGDSFSFEGISFYVLWPPKEMGAFSNINDASLVLLMDYGSFEALLTGDISTKVQERLNLDSLDYVIQGGIDVYKVPHHGSKYSFDKEFLLSLQPKMAVVSVGENSYGHPSLLFSDHFLKQNISFYRTDLDGGIRVDLRETP